MGFGAGPPYRAKVFAGTVLCWEIKPLFVVQKAISYAVQKPLSPSRCIYSQRGASQERDASGFLCFMGYMPYPLTGEIPPRPEKEIKKRKKNGNDDGANNNAVTGISMFFHGFCRCRSTSSSPFQLIPGKAKDTVSP